MTNNCPSSAPSSCLVHSISDLFPPGAAVEGWPSLSLWLNLPTGLSSPCSSTLTWSGQSDPPVFYCSLIFDEVMALFTLNPFRHLFEFLIKARFTSIKLSSFEFSFAAFSECVSPRLLNPLKGLYWTYSVFCRQRGWINSKHQRLHLLPVWKSYHGQVFV